ncbi:hypothetical protein H072_4459 [Dactylellina haptotyla CBS 200.50]|uniref:H/ACA ribonucleoprotein complex non-core subunit NAF1 n=1 Tax=Dactylellina haptotyla (strain CBS 200.50) TaxID=1284197 RepID=S8C206_DACHA|nr:hypothetical protein H072_4459 [Dactylellina haptotyla CBS 200.50]
MDSDPILYGDGPENQPRSPFVRDDQPSPKRPRLSLDEDRESTIGALANPSSSTVEPTTKTIDTDPNSGHNDDASGQQSDPSPIPGLFLATDITELAVQPKRANAIIDGPANSAPEDVDDGEVSELKALEGFENSKLNENERGEHTEDSRGGEVVNDIDDVHQDVSDNELRRMDEMQEDQGDHPSIIRGIDDFLEKGKANLGDPNAEWQLDSSADEAEDNKKTVSHPSPSPSSSDDLSSTSSDSGDDDGESTDNDEETEEDAIFLDIQKEAKRLMDEDGGSDDDGANGFKKGMSGPYRTKNELPEARSARPNIDISASTPIVFLGTIDSVVNDLILIRASVSGEYQVLNEQSLLCFEDRSLLGPVQETFGRVEQPFYTVRLKDAEEVKSLSATEGRNVHYIPSHSTFLFTKSIRALKGSDASNLHDEEVGDDEREFSDDEAEADFKRRQKEERKAKGQHRAQPQPSDAIDEPYVPLSRPANLHEMSAPPSQVGAGQKRETPQRMPTRDYNQANRGGGGGGFRGRGGRGGGGGGRGGRQPQGRMDVKSSPRRPNQNLDHHRPMARDERPPVPASESRSAHNQAPDTNSNPSTQIPTPQGFPAFLPFLPPGQAVPPFPTGAHINPAFFPMPPNPPLPFPGQFGHFPPPPPHLPLNPAQLPLLQTPQQQHPPPPPSVEDILKILRSQGHNL